MLPGEKMLNLPGLTTRRGVSGSVRFCVAYYYIHIEITKMSLDSL
jgi:hypothetical protein